MDKRPDRLEAFRDEFKREAPGQGFERFPALTASIAEQPKVNARIGCLLSHRGVIEMARERGWEYVVAFEDDVSLVPDAGARWTKAIEQLGNRPWELLFLGQNTQGPIYREQGNLYRISRCVALHAVVYHRRSYDAILRRLPATEAEALPFVARHKAIDVFFERHVIPLVPAYCVWPHLAHQRAGVSDIQGTQTVATQDDARTQRWIVGSASAFWLRTAGWNWGRRPVYRVTERITPLRKRRFYASATTA
ncbi:MAG: hypothetical protein AAGL98_04045 [Planctomycetota bacterium]